MTDLQAAIGLVQLGRLDQIVAERRERAQRYHERLLSASGLQLVDDPPYGTTNFQSFWVVLPGDFPESRDALLGATRRGRRVRPPRDHGLAPRARLRRLRHPSASR